VKIKSVLLCFLVLMGIVVFAQQLANPSKNAKPAFTMTISTEHEIITPGSKVIVTVHLTNVSDRELRLVRLRMGGPDGAASCHMPQYREPISGSELESRTLLMDAKMRLAP